MDGSLPFVDPFDSLKISLYSLHSPDLFTGGLQIGLKGKHIMSCAVQDVALF